MFVARVLKGRLRVRPWSSQYIETAWCLFMGVGTVWAVISHVADAWDVLCGVCVYGRMDGCVRERLRV